MKCIKIIISLVLVSARERSEEDSLDVLYSSLKEIKISVL